jgi:hypothetical protein
MGRGTTGFPLSTYHAQKLRDKPYETRTVQSETKLP